MTRATCLLFLVACVTPASSDGDLYDLLGPGCAQKLAL